MEVGGAMLGKLGERGWPLIRKLVEAGITTGGSITVLLTSCLTGLD